MAPVPPIDKNTPDNECLHFLAFNFLHSLYVTGASKERNVERPYGTRAFFQTTDKTAEHAKYKPNVAKKTVKPTCERDDFQLLSAWKGQAWRLPLSPLLGTSPWHPGISPWGSLSRQDSPWADTEGWAIVA